MHEMLNTLELIEQTGLLRALVLLSEKKRFVTELKRSAFNPRGIGSQSTVTKVREILSRLELATEQIEEGPRPRTFLVITEKGRLAAAKIKELVEIVED